MTLSDESAIENFLRIKENIGHVIFDRNNFMIHCGLDGQKACACFDKAVSDGRILELCPGWYYDPHSSLVSPYIRDDLLDYVRPHEFFYVSFEYMLFKYGFIVDAVTTLTVATTGEEEIIETREGNIFLRHVDIDDVPKLEKILLWDSNRQQYIATPKIAIMDSINAGIQFAYTDRDVEFVESGLPDLYEVQKLPQYGIYDVTLSR